MTTNSFNYSVVGQSAWIQVKKPFIEAYTSANGNNFVGGNFESVFNNEAGKFNVYIEAQQVDKISTNFAVNLSEYVNMNGLH